MPIIMACDTAVAFTRKRCPMVDWIRNASRILRWLTGARQRTRLASGHEVRFLHNHARPHTRIYNRHKPPLVQIIIGRAIRTAHSHWNNGHSILSRDHLIINHFCSNNTCFFSTTTIHLPIDRARFRLEPRNCLCVKTRTDDVLQLLSSKNTIINCDIFCSRKKSVTILPLLY